MKKFINEKGNFTLAYFSTYAGTTVLGQRLSGIPLFSNSNNGDYIGITALLYNTEPRVKGKDQDDTWVKEFVIYRGMTIEEAKGKHRILKSEIINGVWDNGSKFSPDWRIEIARFPYTDEGADQACEFIRKMAKEKKMKQHAVYPHLWQMAY